MTLLVVATEAIEMTYQIVLAALANCSHTHLLLLLQLKSIILSTKFEMRKTELKSRPINKISLESRLLKTKWDFTL